MASRCPPSSPPAKKKKIHEMSYSYSWTSILQAPLDTSAVPEDIHLEQTLSFCDVAEFITLPRCMKETVLRCILKGACEQLIPNILESVSNPPRDSLNEKIKRYELAPSGVAAHEVLTVSKIILAHTFHPKWKVQTI